MMQGYIANTHHDWFDFLSRKAIWEEVNFWSPSDYYRFRGAPGSPFFFRLKSPRNVIGGFGIVSRFDRLPEWLAWECFGRGNGAPALESLQARLAELRRTNRIRQTEAALSRIGCILLCPAVFFPENLWVPQPDDWGRQNLRYKTYDLTRGEGLRIWQECQERYRVLSASEVAAFDREEETGRRYGTPILLRPRLGQGTFRLAVTEAYGGACAATGEHSLPALEAAHIRPYSKGGAHDVKNGLLLRSDLHRLFDRGYITVTPEHRLEVSKRLRLEYDNGRTYYPLHGTTVQVPRSPGASPAKELLEWHNNHVFCA